MKGRSISGLKPHLAITPEFKIIEGFLTGENKADISFASELTKNVVEDKGYNSDKHSKKLQELCNIPVILEKLY
ncbi:MAG: hypothetical protein P857_1129 [Candidatus Xenolissoclinum pacificiensis L6]|uniref:Uncharacterized protein n=1 Tax=Candidatus Xenolissoclinum pacificiensis L6 TaxID=1401685 RepID=W2V3A7_9RICK|nr:MAG: hypothetical protein P857_1129 [Candidatus Xenolissoclinum pacificiensis L6]